MELEIADIGDAHEARHVALVGFSVSSGAYGSYFKSTYVDFILYDLSHPMYVTCYYDIMSFKYCHGMIHLISIVT